MIPLNRPDSVKDEVINFIGGSKESISSIENAFERYIGANAIFTSSCRSALYLAYNSLKLNGEVIVSPLTCSIAIMPIIWNNLEPYFVDIDPYTYNIDPEKINESITRKTCAIQVIHLAGNPCDMKPIKELVEDYNLILIEDCAQSLGAEYKGEKVGSIGDIGCFSFMKSMFTIGGGMIATNDQKIVSNIRNIQEKLHKPRLILKYYRLMRNLIGELRGNVLGDRLYDLLMDLRDNDFSDKTKECNFLRNTVYKPTYAEASVCLSQFKKLDNFLEKRMNNASLLSERIQKIPEVRMQKTTKLSKHVFTRYMIKTKYNSIDVIKKLQEKKIEAKHLESKYGSTYQERFDRDPFFSRFKSIKYCEKYLNIHDHIVSLPISSNMTKEEILFITEQVDETIREMSKQRGIAYESND